MFVTGSRDPAKLLLEAERHFGSREHAHSLRTLDRSNLRADLETAQDWINRVMREFFCYQFPDIFPDDVENLPQMKALLPYRVFMVAENPVISKLGKELKAKFGCTDWGLWAKWANEHHKKNPEIRFSPMLEKTPVMVGKIHGKMYWTMVVIQCFNDVQVRNIVKAYPPRKPQPKIGSQPRLKIVHAS